MNGDIEAVLSTPGPSLAEIRADALDTFADDINAALGDLDESEYDRGCRTIITAARERAARLRQGEGDH